MPARPESQAVRETIIMLAEQIARTAPECADRAMQIIDLVRQLAPDPDRATIRDTIEATTADSDLSDARVQKAADAVMEAVRDEP